MLTNKGYVQAGASTFAGIQSKVPGIAGLCLAFAVLSLVSFMVT